MPQSSDLIADHSLLNFLKEISGRRVEDARRKSKMRQPQFAAMVGMSDRWLRELEAGNPASTLDDHVLCSFYLSLPLGHLLFPLLFAAHGMTYPNQLAYADVVDLERCCIDLVAERQSRMLVGQLTPRWRSNTSAG